MHLGTRPIDYVIIAVGIVSLVLATLAYRSYAKSRDQRLLFLFGAFLTMAVKQALTAYAIETGFLPHQDLEAVNSILDLAVVVLLILPLFVSRK